MSRRPTRRGLRLDAAPSLLGGLIRCDGALSHALTASTGASRTGVLYIYYKCIKSTKRGRHNCPSGGPKCCNPRIADLARERADAEMRLGRLYKTIEDGVIDASDPTLREPLHRHS